MDTVGIAPMAFPGFAAQDGLAGLPKPTGLASRRRGQQSVEPLSLQPTKTDDSGLPTPRTSRMDMLKGLRTAPAGGAAPKSATSATFPYKPPSPPVDVSRTGNRNGMNMGTYDNGAHLNGIRTAVPQSQYSHPQQAYSAGMTSSAYAQQSQQYTAEQVLAPPQIRLDEGVQDQIDPQLQAQLLYANAYLSEQQLRLQEQLRVLQAAAQQFEGLNLNGQVQMMPQPYQNPYAQQALHMRSMAPTVAQPNVYSVYDPVTGQQALYVDQGQAQQLNAQLNAQMMQQLQLKAGYFNAQAINTPALQVSPPQPPATRASSPPSRRTESPFDNVMPLPPPSANAFRRGHKKSSSTANPNKGPLSIATDEPLKSGGPRTVSFPMTPATAGFGPGQARAGEHPVRQPRNPPSMEELRGKPTAKHEGSRNFATRTRRSATNNLVRAGIERRKDGRSTGSISPISESTEDLVETPVTDAESESGRSGSGSLAEHDDGECRMPSSRTSTSSYGAIGSERPQSRENRSRNSVDSTTSSSDQEASSTQTSGSFASLLKGGVSAKKTEAGATSQRKAPRLVLTSAEKRKTSA